MILPLPLTSIVIPILIICNVLAFRSFFFLLLLLLLLSSSFFFFLLPV